ncbi:DUF6599 family protein [Candidatus Eisenbacteria bacterium]|uniref:DUF6599 family protein n=1 Tax=Eiseniibacteriota bacterium TaxID=2212470 RepID=A0ABV6YJ49_UNCEI
MITYPCDSTIQSCRLRGGAIGWVLFSLLLLAGPVPTRADTSVTEMLPSDDAVPGWRLLEEPKHFTAEDLWKHINGAAEQYLSFGCTGVAVGYYGREGSEAEISVEIYDMNGGLGSFGLYTQEKPSEGPRLAIGAEGYQAGGDLNFFGGSYYVKMQAYPDDEKEQEATRKLASVVAGTHLANSQFPAELLLFPADSLVSNSFHVIPEAVMGMRGLTSAIVATYRSHNMEMTLHLSRGEDKKSAKSMYTSMRESIAKRTKTQAESIKVDRAEGVRTELKYHGPVILLRAGSDVILASGAVDEPWVHETVSKLLVNIAR